MSSAPVVRLSCDNPARCRMRSRTVTADFPLAAKAGDFGERILFVCSVAFHRGNEIRNEVESSLKHSFNLRPGIFHDFLLCDEAVADAHEPQANDDEQSDDREVLTHRIRPSPGWPRG